MTILTLSRSDLRSGNWKNTKVESFPSPDDVPVLDAAANILLDWMETKTGSAIKELQAKKAE